MAVQAHSVDPPCWAAAIGGCDEKMSREHIVSHCLFNDNEILVQGFPWCRDKPKAIGIANLVAKILCKKHNSDLSELDSAALGAFNVFREAIRMNEVRGRLKPSHWTIKRFTIDGPRLERWFLKTLINLSFDGLWTIGPDSTKEGRPSKSLVEIAFGLREFDKWAGLYIVGEAGETIDSMDRVNCTPLTDGLRLVAGLFVFRGYRFYLNLLPEKFDKHYQADLLYRETTINCSIGGRPSHAIKLRW